MKKERSIFIQIVAVFLLMNLVGYFTLAMIGNIVAKKRIEKYFSEENMSYIDEIESRVGEIVRDIEKIEYAKKEISDEIKILMGEVPNFYVNITNPSGENILEIKKGLFNQIDFDKNEKFIVSQVRTIEIKKGNKTLGDINVVYFHNPILRQKNFVSNLMRNVVRVSISALIIGSVLAMILSKKLTKPIVQVVGVAERIGNGDFTARSSVKSSTKEVNKLTSTINNIGEKLERQELLRSRITADLAHEIRTPLTTLKNNIEAFMDGVWEPTEQRLNSCNEELDRIVSLIDRLDYIYNVEENNKEDDNYQFDITESIENIVEFFRPVLMKDNIAIEFEYNENITVNMSKNKTSQIITNLISNAHRYNKENGKIYVKLNRNKEFLIISVEDTGIGIDDKDKKHIFERLYRAEESRSRETGGCGIGLTIVKKCVDYYEGDIQVDSIKDIGTKFTISIPLKMIT